MQYIISEDIGYEGGHYELVYSYNSYDEAMGYAQMCVKQSTSEDDIALFGIDTSDGRTFEIPLF